MATKPINLHWTIGNLGTELHCLRPFALMQGPLSPVYRCYLSGLIQLPMNIGICLHPIDPAIRGGDHRVSQTQTEHDISLTSAQAGVKKHTHTNKQCVRRITHEN